jgi:hypothetical protein
MFHAAHGGAARRVPGRPAVPSADPAALADGADQRCRAQRRRLAVPASHILIAELEFEWQVSGIIEKRGSASG